MITSPHLVSKPWGYEQWLCDGIRMPYALKKILFRSGNRSSLQVHEFKKETNHVISGTGILVIGTTVFPCRDYLDGKISDDTVNQYLQDLVEIPLESGMTFDVTPGIIHRVIATTDLIFVEASTSELDDVIRLQDDANRPHGKIKEEHA